MGTDTSSLEVANLAPKEAPVAAPTEPVLKELADKISSYTSDDSHPLDVEPDPEPAQVAPKAAASEPPPAAKIPEAPAVQSHPRDLLDAARNLGIPEDYLTPGVMPTLALTDFVVRMRIKDAALESLPRPNQPKEEPEYDPEAALATVEQEIPANPEVLKLLKWQAKKLKELAGQPKTEEVVKQAFAARDQATVGERAIDTAFGQLGAKFEKLFGKGALADMEDGPQKSKRLAVFNNARIDFTKDNPATIRQKVIAAANSVYGDLVSDPAPAPASPASPAGAYGAAAPAVTPEPAKKLMTKEEWEAASLAQPTATKPKKSKGEQAAVDHIKEFYRELGINGHGRELDDEEQFEGVPGGRSNGRPN